MDGRGLRALICGLIVVGCAVAVVWSVPVAVVADAGSGTTQTFHAVHDDDQLGTQGAEHGQQLVQENDDDSVGDDNGATDEDDEVPEPAEASQLDNATDVHISISLHENRSAMFTVDYRFEDADSEEWEQLREDVETNPETYVEYELEDWDSIRADGENETEREMSLSSGSVTTDTSSTPQELGHVTFSFEWSSFAYVELNQMEAGDALVDFTLVEGRSLQVFPPEGYVISDVEPAPDDPREDSVRWNGGETEFMEDQPWIVMIENGDNETEPTETENGPAMPWLIVGIALGALAAAGAGGWWYKRRNKTATPPAGTAAGSTDTDTGGDPPASSDPESPTRAGATGTVETDGPNGPNGLPPNSPPPELLSNEERVLRLLETHGGRIKQQQVVSELEWTEAKTSQVVGGLREDDEIDVFRIGRENVLALPEEEDDE
ncbi:hypothetical protein C482_04966 [Natrialba chahannaoensis JCM 10990]|uniref:HTH iclR-type domain-containing protein n=1 Tax=Natrialba chahannaoensis JCM 10990 TaxID=1227492 RepID=M0AWV4_9EURY|nr:hypothetical protein [Natrialba chahannaoensis]ELZ02980.1 hypothetical protein C482_04966 [Natrialba chahannaoensis JCM 10990]